MMKWQVLFLSLFWLFPALIQSQSVKSVKDIPGQKIEIISGDLAVFDRVGEYHVVFDYTGIKIEEYEDEAAYIAYMREDAELRRKDPDEWEQKWFNDRTEVFQPKFLELFHKHAGTKILLNPDDSNLRYELNLHTTYIEIGFNRNFKKSPTYINVIVTLADKENEGADLTISMKYILGKEIMDSYSADFRRIEEAYGKCGKELAAFMRRKVY